MDNAIGDAPSRQNPNQSFLTYCILTVDLGKQAYSNAGSYCFEKNCEIPSRDGRFNRHRDDFSPGAGQLPGKRTETLGCVHYRKAVHVLGMLRCPVLPQNSFVRDEDPTTYTYAFHLEFTVGVETLPNPYRDIHALADQVHRTVGDQELNAEKGVRAEERRQWARRARWTPTGQLMRTRPCGLDFIRNAASSMASASSMMVRAWR
jgi:hypothetical protein